MSTSMDFNSLRPINQPPKPRQLFLPPHLTRQDSIADSLSSEDPLATYASSRDATPLLPRSNASSSRASPQAKSRLAVVLNKASPQKLSRDDFVSADDEPIASDFVVRSRLDQNSVGPLESSREETPVTAPVSRGRGRPKGSTNASKLLPATAVGARQARQVKPRTTPNGFPKRRGRPPKAPPLPPRAIYESLNPPFIVFFCEWKGCKAELHNLDTLRRHIYVVHGEETHCLWGNCGDGPGQELNTDEAFETHMEEAHLVPFAWHVGDGPRNERGVGEGEDEDRVPEFLKDGRGVQVTPWVRGQEVEDVQSWKLNRRRLKELLRRRDENLPDGESSDVVEEEMV